MTEEELNELLRTIHHEVLGDVEEAEGVVFPDWIRALPPSVVLNDLLAQLRPPAHNEVPDEMEEDYEGGCCLS
jgi:hypothetical protein